MRRTKAEAAATRKILLDAALVVFSAKGYTATRLEDVAEQAGVTRGAIYWHFKNKADLHNTLMVEFSQRANTIIEAAIAEGGSFTDILRRVLTHLFTYLETDADFRAVNELTLFKTELTEELREGWQMKLDAINALVQSHAGVMREGIASGDLRPDLDPLEAARAFLSFSNGAASLWLMDPTAFSLKTSAPILADIFIRGIAAKNLCHTSGAR
jgi:TetR/AcrR family acrAB operon transcriptional repressor